MALCINCGATCREYWQKRCDPCYQKHAYANFESQWDAAIKQSSPSTGGLDKDRLRKLIHLCHPDKHNNSTLATEMTQWLLSQRQ
jgi:hypothetical protein